MSGVSFKGVYAIPSDKVQNPFSKNYIGFMTETASLRDADKGSRYNPINDVYYVYIRDENDKKFEDYASRYGIHYRRANQTDLNNSILIKSKQQQSQADKDLKFMVTALRMGAKFDVATENGKKIVSIYDAKGEQIFSKYIIDTTEGLGGKLVKKIEFLDGKTDCVHEYDDEGKYARSVINGDNAKLEFTYDENGKPSMKVL